MGRSKLEHFNFNNYVNYAKAHSSYSYHSKARLTRSPLVLKHTTIIIINNNNNNNNNNNIIIIIILVLLVILLFGYQYGLSKENGRYS